MEETGLPLPEARCLSKEHAAAYLGIGVTLLVQLDVPCVRFGRRCVYDRVRIPVDLISGSSVVIMQSSVHGQTRN